MKSSVRLSYIDASRGFAILLVVIGHVVQYIYKPNNFDSNIVFRMIYAFHMPLFFFLSGYVTRNNWTYIEFVQTTKKRILQLLIPFIVWGIFMNLVRHDEPIYGFLIHPDHGLWFLFHLLLITIYCNTISLVSDKFLIGGGKLKLIIVFTVGYIVLSKVCDWNVNDYGQISMMKYYYPYYVSGLLLGDYKVKICNMRCTIYVGVIATLCFAFLSSMWYRVYNAIPTNENHYVYILNALLTFRYLTAFVGIMGVIALFSKMHILGNSFLVLLGNCSLGIYAIHMVILYTMHRMHILESTGISYSLEWGIISTILLLAVTIVIVRQIRRNNYLSLMLIGDVNKSMISNEKLQH